MTQTSDRDEVGVCARRRTRRRAAVAILLVAFSARPLLSSTGALLPQIQAALQLSGGLASALTAAPILCMGLFALHAGRLGRRYGLERALAGAMALLCAAMIARSAGSTSGLVIGTLAGGMAMAVMNVLLPVFVKMKFADRAALMTSLYTTGIGTGAATGAALTLPLQRAFGLDWQGALLIWSLPVALTLAVLWMEARDAGHAPLPADRRSVLWRDPAARRMTLFFALHSGLSYTVFGWLGPLLAWRGLPAEASGYVVGGAVVGQMGGTLMMPHLAARLSDQRAIAGGFAVGSAAMLSILLWCPLPIVPWLAPLQGLFQGSLLALSMMMIVQRSPDPDIASRVSAMMQSVGMAAAAAVPFLVGSLFGWTGGLLTPALFLLAVGAAAGIAGYGAGGRVLIGAARCESHTDA